MSFPKLGKALPSKATSCAFDGPIIHCKNPTKIRNLSEILLPMNGFHNMADIVPQIDRSRINGIEIWFGIEV